MKILRSLLLAGLAVAILTTSAVRADDLHDRLAELYDGLGKSISAKQIDGVKGVLADDFVSQDAQGTSKNKDTTINEMQQVFTRMKTGNVVFTLTDAKRVDDHTVVAHVSVHSEMTVAGDQGDHQLVSDEKDEDTWVTSGDSMHLQKSVTLSSTGTIDGKPMQ